MCRLLAVRASLPFDARRYLEPFAFIARRSKEFQGDGWGCSLLWPDGTWRHHHEITPIWESDLGGFGATTLLIGHARSAFRNEGIEVANNMPFHDDAGRVFVFNGELHGVRIQADGRIGAEKVFRFVSRFRDRGEEQALRDGTAIIERRSRYVRAMNIVLSDGRSLFVSSRFNEDPDYFTMHVREGDPLLICSDPLPGIDGFQPFPEGETRAWPG